MSAVQTPLSESVTSTEGWDVRAMFRALTTKYMSTL